MDLIARIVRLHASVVDAAARYHAISPTEGVPGHLAAKNAIKNEANVIASRLFGLMLDDNHGLPTIVEAKPHAVGPMENRPATLRDKAASAADVEAALRSMRLQLVPLAIFANLLSVHKVPLDHGHPAFAPKWDRFRDTYREVVLAC